MSLIQSHNPSDWKVAIIEADNMLDDLTISLGLVGDNLGERLKSAEESTFKTISYAWEAHLFRNRIVHENIAISHFDAQRIIYLFEMVFKEFNFI